ncbi:MAG: putative transport system permease protein [Rhodospirillaceae bacterium]|jgi:putative ABC transport system permease protein|nr:putative transport system permease protein [Rhodospirillaceae bacterium]
MSFVALAFAYLRRRWGQALLSIFVGALGIAAVATAIVGFDALPQAARRAWGGIDLVVGPKGSALDLVLCCALHVSEPRGLVPMKAAMTAVGNPMIRAAAPIALGDNVDGWRIMGSTPAILNVYRARIASGQMWTDKLQAVLGASAARALNFKLGDSFVGAHGLAAGGESHEKFPYKVVGILAPTGSALDRLVLTDIETVRYVHIEQAKAEIAEKGSTDEESVADLPDGATAVVASYRVPTAAAFMPRQIDATDNLSAASPTLEIARLIGYVRPLTIAVTGLGLLLVIIAASGAAIGLMATMNARTRDLALLRALGASPAKIAMVAFAEASMIMTAALVLGGVLAACLLVIGRDVLADTTGLLLQPQLGWDQIAMLLLGTISVTIVAAAFPALRAIHTQIEELLQL